MRNILLCTVAAAFVILPCSAANPNANAVIWRAPGAIQLEDWIWGPGGEAGAPKPPYEFIEEDLHGTNPKIRVRDAAGAQWVVKFGGENHSDVFTSRLLHAMGYLTEPSYFVADGVVTGTHSLRRAKPFIRKDGSFVRARFKLRDKSLTHVRDVNWAWNENPFAGTHELNGLKILMMLTSNWDAKDSRDGNGSNTAVYSVKGPAGPQSFYAFDDWGASMGKWGGFFKRDKWDPEGYRQQSKAFVRLKDAQKIEWGYSGKHGKDVTEGIGVEDIRWLLTYLAPVTDEELRAGLRASGATDAQIDRYVPSIRERITQLQRISGSTLSATR